MQEIFSDISAPPARPSEAVKNLRNPPPRRLGHQSGRREATASPEEKPRKTVDSSGARVDSKRL